MGQNGNNLGFSALELRGGAYLKSFGKLHQTRKSLSGTWTRESLQKPCRVLEVQKTASRRNFNIFREFPGVVSPCKSLARSWKCQKDRLAPKSQYFPGISGEFRESRILLQKSSLTISKTFWEVRKFQKKTHFHFPEMSKISGNLKMPRVFCT